ncbi:dehydrogenase/reductase SDR family member 4-like [Apostichopus japonicus]|uniref:dehydrogenase/reductase SDR family member 4-like n=1 Tax=Stichopus japonicus TaxID=307972 RepID=UPI003AB64F08
MSLERFLGKVAIMTGATQGIGLSSALRVGKEGAKVIISSRKQANIDQAVDFLKKEGIEASGIVCHQNKKEDRRRLLEYAVDTYGGFDHVLVNAGANSSVDSLLTVTEEQFQRTFNTNVKSVFQFIQECFPFLKERGGGSIVANSSFSAYDPIMCVADTLRLYGISKVCLISVIQQVARDCFNNNIRVNCVTPGGVETPFLKGGVSNKMVDAYGSLSGVDMPNEPAGRYGQPDEIASVIAFLLSNDASYMAGQSVIASGGFICTRAM